MRLLMLTLGAATLAIAGCGGQTMSPERAAAFCESRAKLAERPRGRVGIGAGSGGVSTDVGVVISSDFLLRRDPQDVYDACFTQKTGFPPMSPR